ncbi:glutamate 5-kinase [Helicobacter equorum]|uniref:Glutamate 5-kinase n=1 Tax=Helicobacter equorum TaxID=361872 RepID=A0A3D8IPU7_9HELI|nr:glutamate 5-kinase [Helicobacter equorum]RDU66945.1 glutamate 5-kinase [Helicobacter equorum]
MKPRIVLKVGSSNISNGEMIDENKLEAIAKLICELRTHYDILLVSSGAVASGYTRLKIDKSLLSNKQALASIGQPLLMQTYRTTFQHYGIEVAQILVTKNNFDSRTQTKCAKDCIDTLLAHQILPIINENDSTALTEFVGDNDRLSAYVAHYFDAQLLVILSDIDGYFDKNPTLDSHAKILPRVTHIQPQELEAPHTPNAKFATGGIVTKLMAAHFLLERQKSMFLTNGNKLDVLRALLIEGKQTSGTLFGTLPTLPCIIDSK